MTTDVRISPWDHQTVIISDLSQERRWVAISTNHITMRNLSPSRMDFSNLKVPLDNVQEKKLREMRSTKRPSSRKDST